MSRDLQQILEEFCEPILVKQDHIDLNIAIRFFNSLTKDDQLIMLDDPPNRKQEVCRIVRSKIYTYISSYNVGDAEEPFSFDSDSGSGLNEYIKEFNTKYTESFQTSVPKIFEDAFECIKEASESYRLFENFNKRHREELEATVSGVINPALTSAKNDLSKAAEQAAKNASQEAKKQAEEASTKAQEAVNRVDVEIQKKMADVVTKSSETTVTILGMFTCIVVTIVAGLLYSSSVIANINAENFNELIAAAAIIGLICFDMIAIMFLYIEKHRSNSNVRKVVKILIVCVNLFLIAVFVFFCVLHFKSSKNLNLPVTNESGSETDIVNDYNESGSELDFSSDSN